MFLCMRATERHDDVLGIGRERERRRDEIMMIDEREMKCNEKERDAQWKASG